LAKYNGDTLGKALRSEIQKHQEIAYIFSGSEQSVMLAMLKDRQRAFYKLGRIMALGPIDRKIYSKAYFNLYQGFSHEQSINACLSLFPNSIRIN